MPRRSSRGRGRRIKAVDPERRLGARIWRALKAAGVQVKHVRVAGTSVRIEMPAGQHAAAQRVLASRFGLRLIAPEHGAGHVRGVAAEIPPASVMCWQEKAAHHRLIG